MVDFRVNVIWTTGKDDTAFTGFIKVFDNFFTFFMYVFL